MAFYRRKLPHWHPADTSIFVTWRLFGSLPANFSFAPGDVSSGQAFALADRHLDRALSGPVWLKDPRVASLVVDSLLFGDRSLRQYDLQAYVVMANHVHLLLSPRVELRKITQGIKGTTAQRANRLLDREGLPFWQHESFDHWPRNDFERRRIIGYIESNPVKAGLVQRDQDWPWSSAASRQQVMSK